MMPTPNRPTPTRPTPRRASARTGDAPDRLLRATDRLLSALGADPAFVEAVLGDLAEEHAMRTARHGARAAHAWYLRESLRSAPHVLASALTRRPWFFARYVMGLGIVAATLVALIALDRRPGTPARLIVDTRAADSVVVNHIRPVRLPLRVLDSAGRELAGDSVRYRLASAAPVALSSRGVITCTHRGDFTVVASLGTLTKRFLVHCRPVRAIHATAWNDFVVGGPSREWRVDFAGLDGRSVRLLSARVAVEDSNIAVMNGLHIRPLAVGRTHLSVRVGDRSSGAAIRVFEEVPTLDGLRADQRLVAVPIRLIPGRREQWTLPEGTFSLVFLEGNEVGQDANPPAPLMSVDGPIMCLPALAPRVYNSRCLARAPGATLTVAHPGATARTVVGHVAVERDRR